MRKFPWQRMLGETIIQYVARRRAEGYTKEQVIQELYSYIDKWAEQGRLPYGWTIWEAKDHARKTVIARWAEHSKALKSYVAEKKTLAVFAASIRRAEDGGYYIYISPKIMKKLELDEGDGILLKVLKVKRTSKGQYSWEYVEKEEGEEK